MLHWAVLIISGMFEAVWATALGHIETWREVKPVIAFFVGAVISMGGLWWALKGIPVGTGYAVWVGIGMSATVIYNVVWQGEYFSLLKGLLVLGIMGCAIGLMLLPEPGPGSTVADL